MANVFSNFISSKSKKTRFCSIYIDNFGFCLAVTPNRLSTESMTIDSLQYFPFEQPPTAELISFLLNQAVKEYHLQSVRTHCILSRDMYRLILIDVPSSIPKEELREAAKWLIKDLIDFPIDNLVCDAFILPKLSQAEDKAYVSVARKDILQVRQQQIVASELCPVEMSIIDLALTALLSTTQENQVHVLVSLESSQATLLITMNHNLCLKHHIECSFDSRSEHIPLTELDELSKKTQSFIKYFLAQVNEEQPIEVIVLPVGIHTELIIDTMKKSLPYPVKKIDISRLFHFSQSTTQQDIDHCIVALGGLLNKG
jgi:MSHA biogenesis protein MshI